MALRTLGTGLALIALVCVGGCRSRSNYCSPCGPTVVSSRPACPTPGCGGPAPCATAPVTQVPPPPPPAP